MSGIEGESSIEAYVAECVEEENTRLARFLGRFVGAEVEDE